MFYYMSFADPDLPKEQQFLGATILEAEDELAAAQKAWDLGRNPGGEILFAALHIKKVEDLPPDARKYAERFIPRDEVLAEPHERMIPEAN